MNEPQYYEARPNKMFPPQLTSLIRFVRFKEGEFCSHCGAKRKKQWTMLVPFHAVDMLQFTTTRSDKELPALSPICDKHMMAPAERFEPAIGCFESASG